MIKDFTPRLYQETILETTSQNNTLVVLPTGMGKTALAFLLAAQRLTNYPKSKIVLLAPTKPLAQQHLDTFKKHFDLNEDEMILLTGETAPDKRAELWNKAKIIFSTPQGMENDIISGRIKLEEVSLLVVDEAHRAVGDYAYVFIAKQYNKKAKYPRILALTASPGSDMEKIQEIIKNLHIGEIEIRNYEDPDVKPYVKDIDIKWVKVKLSDEFSKIQYHLKDFVKNRKQKLKDWGILKRKDLEFVSKTDLLRLQGELRARASSGTKDFIIWKGISVLAELMKIQHALELLETQGIVALYAYLEKLRQDAKSTKTKAVKNIVIDLNFRSAFILTEKLFKNEIKHPKLIELQNIIKKEIKPKTKIMIFNQYRDNANNVCKVINKIKGVNAELFVGQTKKGETGLSQKEQKAMLDRFRNSEFNVLVATSVGEEGLDIPKVDLVIFFEPIPSAIRTIQRRGRTGRQEKGRVIILMTEKTRDEAYKWSAHHKEKRMYRNLDSLKKKITLISKKQENLDKYVEAKEKFKIFIDHRERSSGVVKELIELGAEIKLEALDNADYICSSKVGIELKKVNDFVNSIIDGRLLEQIRNLKNNFERPLVLVEGEENIYAQRNIHANAIRGMIATIAVSYGIPLIYTKNPKDSAALIHIIAKREQEESGKDFAMHFNKKLLSLKEQQEYIVSALPAVGPKLAKELLSNLGSVKNIINASEKELQIKSIGKKIAKNIRDVLDKGYDEKNSPNN